jgi:cell division protein FtsN
MKFELKPEVSKALAFLKKVLIALILFLIGALTLTQAQLKQQLAKLENQPARTVVIEKIATPSATLTPSKAVLPVKPVVHISPVK